ncbi:hypothetical protein [Parageobacillus thermoglucosidasius]|uniref:hypothetical protein n=1 Tax=Parageobacillus thermoglucosidasius TaxID=1426 RepID=UPI000B58650D|nr:hypothetical protein [Parageobacillus thermoglucosidasius]OUM93682.1 MAG: hypothetical protein BAA00_14475 [Parageobacillus thermoglucosidasius]
MERWEMSREIIRVIKWRSSIGTKREGVYWETAGYTNVLSFPLSPVPLSTKEEAKLRKLALCNFFPQNYDHQ